MFAVTSDDPLVAATWIKREEMKHTFFQEWVLGDL
jgi:hypothetical protein